MTEKKISIHEQRKKSPISLSDVPEGLMLIRETKRRILTASYIATIWATFYFLSLLLAKFWSNLRFAIIEFMFETFSLRFSC